MKRMMLLLLMLIFSLSGCTYAKLMATGGKPIIFNTPMNQDYTIVDHVRENKMIAFDYTSTLNITDLTRETLSKYPDADAIINVIASSKITFGDFLVNLFTIGIADAKTITIEGDIIKFNK